MLKQRIWNRVCLFVLLLGIISPFAKGQSREDIRTSGDVMAMVTPMASLVTTLALKDYEGLKQGALAGVTTVAATYALKYIVQKERPDGSNKLSFPSAILPSLLPERHLYSVVMVGSGVCRHISFRRMWDGAGYMERNMIGGMWQPVQQ